MSAKPTRFFWYELMTTDMDAAERFYTAVVGWRAEPFSGAMPYTVLHSGERGVGGIMKVPNDSLSPAWVGYVKANDIDAQVDGLRKAGGSIHRPPFDIPNVGRIAVVADPQGAMFMLLQPNGPDQPAPPQRAPGHIGWHELYANDWNGALDFYSGLYGWTKLEEHDMGDMGKYVLYGVDGEMNGGMMNRPPQVPFPCWVFYFNVGSIDDAAKRVTDNGGTVVMGPMEVPGGDWVLQGMDPQGAHFALLGSKG